MRVLHTARYFHPHVGGTENVIAALVRELESHGVDSTVAVSGRHRRGDGPEPQVPTLDVPVIGPDRFPVPAGRWRELVTAVRGADIVHVHDLRFLFELTALVRRTPVVLTTHGLVSHTSQLGAVKRAAWRTWHAPRLRALAAVVAVSGRDAGLCRAGGVTANVVTIPNGVDVDAFAAVPDRQRAGVRELLYFGRIAPEKAVERLAPVLAARPSWRVTIAGTGDAAWCAEVRRRFARAGVGGRVVFAGAASAADLRRHLHAADCVVLPSPGESFGLTMVEALAAGVPVVADDTPAYREIAAGTGAGLVPFDDAVHVAGAIEAAVARWEPGPARVRAAEFSWRAAAAAYVKVYDDALRGAR